MKPEAAVLLAISGLAVAGYGRATFTRWHRWRRPAGNRGRQEFLIALALLVTSLFTSAAVIASQVFPPGTPIRPFLAYASYGAFLATAWFVYEAWRTE